MYHGEKLVFTRDATGRATKVEAASVVVRAPQDRRRERRDVPDQAGAAASPSFARRPWPRSRRRRRASSSSPTWSISPPSTASSSTSATRPTTTSSSTPFYTSAKAFMQKPAAEALGARPREAEGAGLRPARSTTPTGRGTSRRCSGTRRRRSSTTSSPTRRRARGTTAAARSISTLYDLKTGKVGRDGRAATTSSPTARSPTTPAARRGSAGTATCCARAMEAEGFTVYEAEWWHFDYKDWQKYPILNKTFEELK